MDCRTSQIFNLSRRITPAIKCTSPAKIFISVLWSVVIRYQFKKISFSNHQFMCMLVILMQESWLTPDIAAKLALKES